MHHWLPFQTLAPFVVAGVITPGLSFARAKRGKISKNQILGIVSSAAKKTEGPLLPPPDIKPLAPCSRQLCYRSMCPSQLHSKLMPDTETFGFHFPTPSQAWPIRCTLVEGRAQRWLSRRVDPSSVANVDRAVALPEALREAPIARRREPQPEQVALVPRSVGKRQAVVQL